MSRREKEYAIVKEMIDIYFDKHKASAYKKEELLGYVKKRLNACPFKDEKSFCSSCKIHCYKQDKRDEIKKVMTYVGPRLIYLRPKLFFCHLLEGLGLAKKL